MVGRYAIKVAQSTCMVNQTAPSWTGFTCRYLLIIFKEIRTGVMWREIFATIYLRINQQKIFRLNFFDRIMAMDRFHQLLLVPLACPETTGSVVFKEAQTYRATVHVYKTERSTQSRFSWFHYSWSNDTFLCRDARWNIDLSKRPATKQMVTVDTTRPVDYNAQSLFVEHWPSRSS